MIDHFAVYFLRHVRLLFEGGLTGHLAFQVGIAGTVLALRLYDGAPVASDCWRWVSARR